MAAHARKANEGLRLGDKTAVVVGGTRTFPSLTYNPTSEGHEPRFVVLASRVLIAEALADAGLQAGVIVHAPGGSATTFDPDDLELGAAFKNGTVSMGAIFERDRGMLDAFTLEFNARHPTIAMYHLNPGLVATRVVHNSGLTQPWKWLLGTLGACLGSDPAAVAELPVFLATVTGLPSARLLDAKLNSVKPTPWAEDGVLRTAVWENLMKLGSEVQQQQEEEAV
ncbi:uncharacterized protein LOC62_02G003078 [Vanrija pseudolonga]|uniref:Ketoreductase (KR) domain-containing protein n=1 Tax=Vanrija pseudolonga TaxID=143232 RepID=A0AAF1BGC8_9TREE|nr:hypothetical protein LOC62_02G003078 [Vanrija pseudolonga]